VSSNLVISLRLRTPFIFMTMKVLKRPIGFLGGLPGPSVWKQLSRAVLAKLKSTFRKRGSRVSCSSCPAWGHLLSLDVYSKIRDPNSNINVRNFGTNQRAYIKWKRNCKTTTRTIINTTTTIADQSHPATLPLLLCKNLICSITSCITDSLSFQFYLTICDCSARNLLKTYFGWLSKPWTAGFTLC
jgi:hypothetical protein